MRKQLAVGLCALTAALFAAPGFAQPINDATYPEITVTTNKSRAEVLAELQAARQAGALPVNDATYPVLAAEPGSKTRAEVRAEGARSLAQHRFDLRYVN
ncbi:MAG: DUF4148 domain-containing protein [Pseudomonadota bacterium]|jgi:hypothetical protein